MSICSFKTENSELHFLYKRGYLLGYGNQYHNKLLVWTQNGIDELLPQGVTNWTRAHISYHI
jgi:hypothetical protein